MNDALVIENVEKQYGGLRPLRVRRLTVPSGQVAMLVGFDRPAAEVLVSLITGAALPDAGEVSSLGKTTREIVDSDQWLAFVERFGIVSDRIVLLEAMTVTQNLAISFDLKLEPVPPEIMARATVLAEEVGIVAESFDTPVAQAPPLLRAKINLARAIAFDPEMLVLEHPTATLSVEDALQYAAIVKRVSARRTLTTVGLLMDEKFAKATGGRLLSWQPASGEMKERSSLRFW